MARRLVHNKDGWESAIGRFILAFNDIERDVALLFHVLPECLLPEASKAWNLGTKLSVLKEVLQGLQGDDPRRDLLPLLVQVKRLSEIRNRIAHGPMRWLPANGPDGQGVLLEGVLTGGREWNQRLSYGEVVRLAEDADAFATEFGDAALPFLRDLDEHE